MYSEELFGVHFRFTGKKTDKEACTRRYEDTYEKLKV
jgi:hypothetical protein